MPSIFRIELLPALHGDALWIEYGDAARPYRILIDGGPYAAFGALEARIARVAEDDRRLELLVVTHVDSDHIEGIVRILNRPGLRLRLRDLWFNGWPQLTYPLVDASASTRSPTQGSFLEVRMRDTEQPWNRWFGGRPVMASPNAPLPVVELAGGLRLTLLSPSPKRLEVLRREWRRSADALGTAPENLDFFAARLLKNRLNRGGGDAAATLAAPEALAQQLDGSVANGSSIAFLAEYAERSCLLLGDAHGPVIEAALKRLLQDRSLAVLDVDAIKVPHHGSAANVTAGLLDLVRCRRFLISTNGDIFGHPDEAAVELLLRKSPRPATLVFNYRSAHNGKWDGRERKDAHGHEAVYPPDGEAGIVVDLL
jgi:beta-lactamase superfamily II metal-dependent hydrolase